MIATHKHWTAHHKTDDVAAQRWHRPETWNACPNIGIKTCAQTIKRNAPVSTSNVHCCHHKTNKVESANKTNKTQTSIRAAKYQPIQTATWNQNTMSHKKMMQSTNPTSANLQVKRTSAPTNCNNISCPQRNAWVANRIVWVEGVSGGGNFIIRGCSACETCHKRSHANLVSIQTFSTAYGSSWDLSCAKLQHWTKLNKILWTKKIKLFNVKSSLFFIFVYIYVGPHLQLNMPDAPSSITLRDDKPPLPLKLVA